MNSEFWNEQLYFSSQNYDMKMNNCNPQWRVNCDTKKRVRCHPRFLPFSGAFSGLTIFTQSIEADENILIDDQISYPAVSVSKYFLQIQLKRIFNV